MTEELNLTVPAIFNIVVSPILEKLVSARYPPEVRRTDSPEHRLPTVSPHHTLLTLFSSWF